VLCRDQTGGLQFAQPKSNHFHCGRRGLRSSPSRRRGGGGLRNEEQQRRNFARSLADLFPFLRRMMAQGDAEEAHRYMQGLGILAHLRAPISPLSEIISPFSGNPPAPPRIELKFVGAIGCLARHIVRPIPAMNASLNAIGQRRCFESIDVIGAADKEDRHLCEAAHF
jgi:hypothetical protein